MCRLVLLLALAAAPALSGCTLALPLTATGANALAPYKTIAAGSLKAGNWVRLTPHGTSAVDGTRVACAPSCDVPEAVYVVRTRTAGLIRIPARAVERIERSVPPIPLSGALFAGALTDAALVLTVLVLSQSMFGG